MTFTRVRLSAPFFVWDGERGHNVQHIALNPDSRIQCDMDKYFWHQMAGTFSKISGWKIPQKYLGIF